MYYEHRDFNGAAEYLGDGGAAEWSELVDVLDGLVPQMQASDQAGKQGSPIFDPKATNAHLTADAARHGWHKVPVPESLRPFGNDWDAGKNAILAEWQFSNYPFLWNNIIRSEAVYKSGLKLVNLRPIRALVIVTKSHSFPASNSTLYYEQACAQLDAVTSLGAFQIPIRLVGLKVDPKATSLAVSWNTYPGRYSRDPGRAEARTLSINRRGTNRYGGAFHELTL